MATRRVAADWALVEIADIARQKSNVARVMRNRDMMVGLLFGNWMLTLSREDAAVRIFLMEIAD
jgi:hypothetical protein